MATELRIDCAEQVAEVHELGPEEAARQAAAEASAAAQANRRHHQQWALSQLRLRASGMATDPLTAEDLRNLLVVLDLDR